jgi:hypothetical protein
MLGAQCKTTTCSAALEWPSYDEAMKSYDALLHGDFRANCARGILLPEPEDRTLPYRGRLLLDCENWRAETM